MPIVQIELQFNDKGTATGVRTVKSIGDAIDGVTRSSDNASKSVSKVGEASTAAFRAAAKEVLALVGAYKALESAMGFLKRGVRFNSEMEQSKVGMASIIASMAKIEDAQGTTLEGAEKYAAAQEVAAKMMQRIQILGLETTATTQELVQGVQSVIAPALKVGMSLEQIPEFALRGAQAMQAMGIPLVQMRTELEAVLSGNINQSQDLLAPRLDLTKETISQWQAQGTFYENIMKKFQAYAMAGQDLANTLKGLMSNLEEALDVVSGKVSRGLTGKFKETIKEAQNLFISIEGGSTGVGKDFEHVAALLAEIETALGEGVLNGVQSLVSSVKSLNEYIGDNGASTVYRDLADAVKIAAEAFGALLVVRAAMSPVLRENLLSLKQGLDSITANTIASYQNADATRRQTVAAQQHALAAKEIAAANLSAAKAALERAVAEEQSYSVAARQIGIITQHEAAFRRLVVAENQYNAAKVASVAAENAHAAAMTRTTGAATTLKGAQAALTGLLTALGGPWGVAITAGAAAIAYMATRQDEATKSAELHSKAENNFKEALKGATDETGALTQKLTELQKQRLDMARQQFGEEYNSKLRDIGKAVDDTVKQYRFARTSLEDLDFSIPGEANYISTLEAMYAALKKGDMSVVDFQDNLAALRQSAVDAGYGNSEFVKTLDSLNQQGGIVDLLSDIAAKMGMVKAASEGAASGVKESANQLSAAARSFGNFYSALEKFRNKTKDGDSKKSPEEVIVEQGENAISGTKAAKSTEYDRKREAATKYLAELRNQLKSTDDVAKQSVISKKISEVSTAITQIGETGSSKVSNATQKWDEFTAKIDELNGVTAKSDTSLLKQLDAIERTGREAGKSAAAIADMKAQYSQAFEVNALKELNIEILKAENNTKALQDAENADKVKTFTNRLNSVDSLTPEQKQGMVNRYTEGLSKQVNVKDAQTNLTFIKEFAELSGNNNLSTEYQNQLIAAQAEIYRSQLTPELRALVDEWAKLQQLKNARDPFSGLTRGLRTYSNEASDFAKGFESLTTTAFSNVETSFTTMLTTGQISFTNFANSIINDLARIAVRAAITGPIANGLSSLFGGMFSGSIQTTNPSSSWANFGVTPGASMPLSAHGNVFSGGNLSAYSGSIVSSPTFFGYDTHLRGFANGAGLMGEAGPEAILPLKRTSSGDLGVRTDGFGGRGDVQVNIINASGEEVTQRTKTDNYGNKSIDVMIGDAAAKQAMTQGTGMNRAIRAATGARTQVTRR